MLGLGGSLIQEGAGTMGVLGQNDSDPGAKRNKEVRQCFKCSFNLSFSENREGNEVQGEGCPNSGQLGREEVGCALWPRGQEEEMVPAAMGPGRERSHRSPQAHQEPLSSHHQDGSEGQDHGSG